MERINIRVVRTKSHPAQGLESACLEVVSEQHLQGHPEATLEVTVVFPRRENEARVDTLQRARDVALKYLDAE